MLLAPSSDHGFPFRHDPSACSKVVDVADLQRYGYLATYRLLNASPASVFAENLGAGSELSRAGNNLDVPNE